MNSTFHWFNYSLMQSHVFVQVPDRLVIQVWNNETPDQNTFT